MCARPDVHGGCHPSESVQNGVGLIAARELSLLPGMALLRPSRSSCALPICAVLGATWHCSEFGLFLHRTAKCLLCFLAVAIPTASGMTVFFKLAFLH